MKRVIWIVLDSVGMGEMPDAHLFGDVGANTIGNISEKLGGLHMPNMQSLGLGNIQGMKGVESVSSPKGSYARLAELSMGKDTTTGHWEMVGIHTKDGFPTYPQGFPKDIIAEFEAKTGRKSFANYASSGTEIIEKLGQKHVETGKLIVYTSADSVFQIAAHEDVVPLEELYEICLIAREMLKGEHAVARVIARPFEGTEGNFTRTPNRRDFALLPPHKTTLDYLKDADLDVVAVGKIEDIFAGQGITKAIHTTSNMNGVDVTIDEIKQDSKGLIFTNLVDFDMKWGHRNDYVNYGKALEEFDTRLPEILSHMNDDDMLFITADHGCDPTFPGTDHTREYVPFLAYGKNIKENIDMKTRKSFADIGQTICEIFNLPSIPVGESFLSLITKEER
ncbi:MAG TPA: phosphopentomutase [Epulopiscium sp.]|nr:phosphopentomutase [Candidatus Epulonipiscium sp.]